MVGGGNLSCQLIAGRLKLACAGSSAHAPLLRSTPMSPNANARSANSSSPNSSSTKNSTRREFLKTSGTAIAGGTLAATLGFARQAHALQNDDAMRVALIGCGGRGTGAVSDAFSTKNNLKLVAMADAFRNRLDDSYDLLKKDFSDRLAVDEEHKFVGF